MRKQFYIHRRSDPYHRQPGFWTFTALISAVGLIIYVTIILLDRML